MHFLIGILAGAHTSSWGMYKDAPHEGFTVPKYLRSIVVAGAIALVLRFAVGYPMDTFAHAAVFFGLVYALERLTLELWKSFIREEDQSKYFIPMQFGAFGKPIQSRAVRWSVMLAVIVVVVAAIWGVTRLQAAYPDAPKWMVLLLASAGGWFSAFGGAWKDAPVEGFETFKFFRSPVIATTWSAVMGFLTDNWVFMGLAGIGYTVATIETYKTFFFPNKPRGKFAGKPILFPEILERRKVVAVLYACIWAAVLTILVLAFLGPKEGVLP
ncbi:MAG TPA: hypothetical protein VHG91_07195 [Longimicrobium sp.]|nr:hypothetical protein [Longimicrobium sp.]